MSRAAAQGAKSLFGPKIKTKFDYGLASKLPPAYHKFLAEYNERASPVHFVPQVGEYTRSEKTGEVKPIQNVPIPLKFPNESHQGIWGGEAVVKGFRQPDIMSRRVPHYWVPVLRKEVVHSVILNKYMSLQVTERTIELIHKHKGFDNYILETKASDLQSYLALSLKREMIRAIQNGLPDLSDDPVKQKDLLAKYLQYGEKYTSEELEWYGLSMQEAIEKIDKEIRAAEQSKIKPLKHELREKLINELKSAGHDKVEQLVRTEEGKIINPHAKKSWISKFNPFGNK